MNQNDTRASEIALDIAIRLYQVRRPIFGKALPRDRDIDLLSDCVEDARDLVDGITPRTEPPN